MKHLTILALLLFSLQGLARDPGTGSNTTVGPGPATPDAASDSTSVMGGGTPGNTGIDTLGIEEPTAEEQEEMKGSSEETKDEVTDQDPELDTIQEE